MDVCIPTAACASEDRRTWAIQLHGHGCSPHSSQPNPLGWHWRAFTPKVPLAPNSYAGMRNDEAALQIERLNSCWHDRDHTISFVERGNAAPPRARWDPADELCTRLPAIVVEDYKRQAGVAPRVLSDGFGS